MNRPFSNSGQASRRRPTIDDVARRAGVSPALVSFAVNGRPGVAEDTRARILETANELGWRPSASARALTQARTRTIGLVLARAVDQLELDSFFVRFLSGVERALTRADYALLLQLMPASDGPGALAAYERLASAGRVDGFLLTDPTSGDPRLPLLEAAGLPVVIAGRPVEATRFAWLETEHDLGISKITEHLLSLGHERIGFLGGPESYEHMQRRAERWREALARANQEAGPVVFAGPDLAAAATAVLEDSPTAVVCASDTLAIAVLAAARERGLIVPHDLSVTGFDDSLLAALSSPTLTSVRVDYTRFGEAATMALLAAIGGSELPGYQPSAPEVELRGSTSVAPARNMKISASSRV